MSQRSSGTLLASAARTTTATADPIEATSDVRGLLIFVNVTAHAATPSVVPTVQARDPITGTWVNYVAFTAITDVTGDNEYIFVLYPLGLAEETSTRVEVKSAPLPSEVRVSFVAGDADSLTYSAAYQLIL